MATYNLYSLKTVNCAEVWQYAFLSQFFSNIQYIHTTKASAFE